MQNFKSPIAIANESRERSHLTKRTFDSTNKKMNIITQRSAKTRRKQMLRDVVDNDIKIQATNCFSTLLPSSYKDANMGPKKKNPPSSMNHSPLSESESASAFSEERQLNHHQRLLIIIPRRSSLLLAALLMSQILNVVRMQVFDDELTSNRRSSGGHSFFDQPNYYDPERDDGIPVISTRVDPNLGAAIKDDLSSGGLLYDRPTAASSAAFNTDDDNEGSSSSSSRRSDGANNDDIFNENQNRRSLDVDEDRMDDDDNDDRDEEQSSSNRVRNTASYDPHNPPFDESSKAAQEREDIERFFDDHLGPNEEMTPSASSRRASSANDEDGFDGMEMAATSPLSMLSNILFGRVRPTIIHTTSSSPSSSPAPLSTSASSSSWSANGGAGPTAGINYDDAHHHHYHGAPPAPSSESHHYHQSNYNNEPSYGRYGSSFNPGTVSGGGYRSASSSLSYKPSNSYEASSNYPPPTPSRYPMESQAQVGHYGGGSYHGSLTSMAQSSESGETRYPPRKLAPPPSSSSVPHYSSIHYGSQSGDGYRSSSSSLGGGGGGSSSGSGGSGGSFYGSPPGSSIEYIPANRLYGSDDTAGGYGTRMRYATSHPRPSSSHYSASTAFEPSGTSSYFGTGTRNYHLNHQAIDEPEQSAFSSVIMPSELKSGLSPYADSTTHTTTGGLITSGDRALVESLMDYPTHSTFGHQRGGSSSLNYNPLSLRSSLRGSSEGDSHSTLILSGKPFDRPLEQVSRFNINRDDELMFNNGHGLDQPQAATASQPTITNNNSDNIGSGGSSAGGNGGGAGGNSSLIESSTRDPSTSAIPSSNSFETTTTTARQQQQQQQHPSKNDDTLDVGNEPAVHVQHDKVSPSSSSSSSSSGDSNQNEQAQREFRKDRQQPQQVDANKSGSLHKDKSSNRKQRTGQSRVRREDNEGDGDNDDDAQWIDDEDNLDDDDNRQQSSNVDEQSQDPQSDGAGSDNGETISPHGYELSPDDLFVYGNQ